jgi:pimeloyl-ACP methyl ester carboxylesterase
MERVGALRVREHGSKGPRVIVLHGGPAAVGSAVGLAQGLSGWFRVLEPWQRGSGPTPLTVETHIADLHHLVMSRCGDARPPIVGESWGAMLALAYAAAHPTAVSAVGLVGCGTFDIEARAHLQATVAQRQEALRSQTKDSAKASRAGSAVDEGRLLRSALYDFAPIAGVAEENGEPFDMRAHSETWDDMLRLQEAGEYPAAFDAITCPVLMLHGAYDPHPGSLIRDGLKRHVPQLEYREWERCGHSPWIERFVRDDFFATLRAWLNSKLTR